MKLTNEQKSKLEPALHRTAQYIFQDSEVEEMLPKRGRAAAIVELVIDADRPVTLGGMSKEDYKLLCEAYSSRDTEQWLRKVLNY